MGYNERALKLSGDEKNYIATMRELFRITDFKDFEQNLIRCRKFPFTDLETHLEKVLQDYDTNPAPQFKPANSSMEAAGA